MIIRTASTQCGPQVLEPPARYRTDSGFLTAQLPQPFEEIMSQKPKAVCMAGRELKPGDHVLIPAVVVATFEADENDNNILVLINGPADQTNRHVGFNSRQTYLDATAEQVAATKPGPGKDGK